MSMNGKSLSTAALLAFVAVTAVTIGVKEFRHSRAVAGAEASRSAQAAVVPEPDPAPVSGPTPPAASAPIPTASGAVPVASVPVARPVQPPVAKPATVAAAPDPASPPATVIVTYFHATARCVSCLKIEELTNATMTTRFADFLAEKRVVWRTVNVDEPGNGHYVKDYGLYTKSVVVSEVEGGREVRWKNLDQVWNLLKDPAAFQSYVEREVLAFLEKA